MAALRALTMMPLNLNCTIKAKERGTAGAAGTGLVSDTHATDAFEIFGGVSFFVHSFFKSGFHLLFIGLGK